MLGFHKDEVKRSTLGVILSLGLAAAVHAQTLTIQGDTFAVDGVPKFLVFVSYFGAMGADNPTADFQYLKSKGFDGVRIWPNFVTGPQLMRSDGTLNPDSLNRLLFILDRARDQRLIVDVSFTAEHVAGLDAARFRDGIVATTAALKSYPNLLFDIENERNVYGPFGRPLSASDVVATRAAIKSVHPERIVTASNSSVNTAEFAGQFAVQTGLDVTAYHDPRTSHFADPVWVKQIVDAMRANGLPAYMQEPMPTRYPFFPASYVTQNYKDQMLYAKTSGAAAWTFHSDLSEDIRGWTFQALIESQPEPELAFVDALIPRVSFRTANGSNFVVAEGGGGGDVRGDRVNMGAWETFRVIVLSGGPLVSGDRIALATANGTNYLQAIGGGGAGLRAVGTQIGAFETFIIEKADGGPIRHGDAVRLRAANAAWYVAAESGGGGNITVNRPSAGAWETFTIFFR